MSSLHKIMGVNEVRKDKERKTFYLSSEIYRKYAKAVKKHPKAKSVSATIENFMAEVLRANT